MQTEQQNPRSAKLDEMTALEIAQTMNAEDTTVAVSVQKALPAIARTIEAAASCFRQGGRLFYVGAGTSGRLGVLDAAECVPTFSVPPETVQGIIAGGQQAMFNSVEGAEDDRTAGRAALEAVNLTAADMVVGIAASGRTPFTVAAVAYANEIGAVTAAIACNAPAPLLDAAQIPIAVPVGAEVLTGSTRLKAGTAQKMVLNMISTGAMVQTGKVYGNLMVDVQVTNDKLAGRARRIVAQAAGVDEAHAASLLRSAENRVKVAIVMGRLDVPAAAAVERLQQAGDNLRRALDDGK